MKIARLQYFLSQNIVGDKRYYVPPVQKLGGDMSTPSPLNLVPGLQTTAREAILLMMKK